MSRPGSKVEMSRIVASLLSIIVAADGGEFTVLNVPKLEFLRLFFLLNLDF